MREVGRVTRANILEFFFNDFFLGTVNRGDVGKSSNGIEGAVHKRWLRKLALCIRLILAFPPHESDLFAQRRTADSGRDFGDCRGLVIDELLGTVTHENHQVARIGKTNPVLEFDAVCLVVKSDDGWAQATSHDPAACFDAGKNVREAKREEAAGSG